MRLRPRQAPGMPDTLCIWPAVSLAPWAAPWWPFGGSLLAARMRTDLFIERIRPGMPGQVSHVEHQASQPGRP